MTTLASLCALAGGMMLWSAPAMAARGHVFGSSFGSAGAGNGRFSSPAGVAVNESSGDVYVVDEGNNRVEYFSSAGSYLGQFNGTGAPTGKFSSPESIAIDNETGSPSFGAVYVGDTGHSVIDKFSFAGAYIGQLTQSSSGAAFGSISGIATDSSGKLWVCQEGKEIDAFSSAVANEFLSKITSATVALGEVGCGFAVDSNDNIYGRNGFVGIPKLDSSGKLLIEKFDSLIKEFFGVPIGRVAVDLSSNEVYIGNADGENSVGRFSSSGRFIETFGSEHLTQASGIAVNSKTGDVYVADSTTNRVDHFILEPPSRPTIEHESPSEVSASSVQLEAQVKPTGPDTTYYFQYGTVSCVASPASCTDLPAPGIDIGGGFESQSVSVHPQDLQPGTLYHFRVIAVNELGISEGPEQTFMTQITGSEFTQPDGRAWELVTPPEKHGAGIIAVGNEQGDDIQAAADGSAITYGATSPFVEKPAGSNAPEVTQIFSAREAPGRWNTADITAPHNGGPTELYVGHSAEYKIFSSDLSLGLLEPNIRTPLPPQPAGAEKTPYLRATNGEFKALVTSPPVPAGIEFGDNGGPNYESATPDLSHVIIGSRHRLSPTPVEESCCTSYLYEWAAGQIKLASVLPNGTPTGGSLGREGRITRHALSNDGSRLVFEAAKHLYLRDMTGGETVQVDAAQETPEPESAETLYATANGDDSRVFFTSAQRLTADSTASGAEYPPKADLYEFEMTSGKGQPLAGKLRDLTVDGNAGESADLRGVIEASEDGSYVYFVANGVLGDGAAHAAGSGNCERISIVAKQTCDLYVEHYNLATKTWAPPTFIATLSGNDANSWGRGTTDLNNMTSRVSPNGRYLTFMSERSLTGYENPDANSDVPDEEVFLYDAATGHLICTSCNPTGARPVGLLEGNAYEENLVDYAKNWGERWFAANIPGWTSTNLSSALRQSRYLSSSGRLFFNSSDALVPADVNGKEDVYEYEPAGVGSCQPPGYGRSASIVFSEAVGGCIALISAGSSSEESAFMEASETGSDVFFQTLSRLGPTDVDTSIDLYDAHECSASSPCAPQAALAPPPCTTGDACKTAPTPQPALFGAPASATFSGAGNVVPSTSSSRKRGKPSTRAQKLAKALHACRTQPKRRRVSCERQARQHYGGKRSRAGRGSAGPGAGRRGK